MTNWQDFSSKVNPQSLIRKLQFYEKKAEEGNLYIGKEGLLSKEKISDLSGLVKVTKKILNEITEEAKARLEKPDAFSEWDISEIPATQDPLEELVSSSLSEGSTTDPITSIDWESEVESSRLFDDEQTMTNKMEFPELFADEDVEYELVDQFQEKKQVVEKTDAQISKSLKITNREKKLAALKQIRFKVGMEKPLKLNRSKENPQFASFLENQMDSLLENQQKKVSKFYYHAKMQVDARKSRAWQGCCHPKRLEHLLIQQSKKGYLLATDRKGDSIYAVFLEQGNVKTFPLELSDKSPTIEGHIMASLGELKPIETKPLSFFQGQIDWHATDKAPAKVFKEFGGKKGDCCITREDDPNQFTMHVLLEDQGKHSPFTIKTNDTGIYTSFINKEGEEIEIKAERLHDLFEHKKFPATHFLYKQFGRPFVAEEKYYRKVLQWIPKGSEDFIQEKLKFSGQMLLYGDRGAIVEKIDDLAQSKIDSGQFTEYHKTLKHISSLQKTAKVIGIPTKTVDIDEQKKSIEVFSKIHQMAGPLKYNLVPRKITYKDPITKNVSQSLIAPFAPGGELFDYHGKISPIGQLRVARDLFLGAKELMDKKIIKRDIKPSNVLCMSNDVNDLKAVHADHADPIFTDEPIPKVLTTTSYYLSPVLAGILVKKRKPNLRSIKNDQLYSLGATLYTVFTSKLPLLGRGDQRYYLDSDFLKPINPFQAAQSPLFVGHIKEDGFPPTLKWKEPDSMARIIWDCIFINFPDAAHKNKITLKSAIERINKLLEPLEVK